jgi:hypothetical protein
MPFNNNQEVRLKGLNVGGRVVMKTHGHRDDWYMVVWPWTTERGSNTNADWIDPMPTEPPAKPLKKSIFEWLGERLAAEAEAERLARESPACEPPTGE